MQLRLARVSLLAAALARAAGADPAPEATAVAPRWIEGLRLRMGVSGIHAIDYGASEVSWLRTQGSVALGGPVSDRAAASVSFSIEYEDPSFDSAGGFLPDGTSGAPIEELIESTLRFGGRLAVRERWFIGAEPYLSAKLESGAELSEALKGGVVFVVEYQPSETFDVMAGIKLGSRLDRSGPYAWPYLRLRWDASDRLELRVDNARVRLLYELRDAVELRVFAGARTDRYRITPRAALPTGPGEGTFSQREVAGGVGVRWDASRHVRVAADVGLVFWQRLEIASREADPFVTRSTHAPAPFAGLNLETRF